MTEPTETSPLLATENNIVEDSGNGDDITSFPEMTTYSAARDFFPRPIKIINLYILVTSFVSFVLLVATAIILNNSPLAPTPYIYIEQFIITAGSFVFITLFVALINLRVKVPIWLNFLIDICLLWSFLTWLPNAPLPYYFPNDDWCEPYYPKKPVQPGCLNYLLAAKILIYIGGGLAAVIWVLHLVLLVIRCVAAWKSKFWRRASGFTLPTGELTFQFTIKLLRQETGTVVPGAGAGVVSTQQGSQ